MNKFVRCATFKGTTDQSFKTQPGAQELDFELGISNATVSSLKT